MAIPGPVPTSDQSTASDGDNDEGYNLAIGQIMDGMVKQLHESLQVPYSTF